MRAPAAKTDSKKFLYRLRGGLAKYAVKVVGARGQAVRLFYASDPYSDITPVFVANGGGYVLPSGDGGWLLTDPDRNRGPESDPVLSVALAKLSFGRGVHLLVGGAGAGHGTAQGAQGGAS